MAVIVSTEFCLIVQIEYTCVCCRFSAVPVEEDPVCGDAEARWIQSARETVSVLHGQSGEEPLPQADVHHTRQLLEQVSYLFIY